MRLHRRLIAGLALLLLPGCRAELSKLLGHERYEVVLIDKPTVLGSEPVHLSANSPLEVRGVTTDLCVGSVDDVSRDGDIDAALSAATGGVKLSATLHGDDGTDHLWICSGWSLQPSSPSGGRRSA